MKEKFLHLIETLQLQKHPEGGYYRETYRSAERIPATALPRYGGNERDFSTAIFFLLVHPDVSRFHRLKSDELWHFYEGSPVTIHMIGTAGDLRAKKLSPNIDAGESYQAVIPAGTWFAVEVTREGTYAFMGCTVAPGFDFDDFEPGKPGELVKLFPGHTGLITRLTV